MVRLIDDVLDTVTRPDAITPDPRRGRWRYWRAETGPSRWLFVVVDWRESEPEVVTAFGPAKGPSLTKTIRMLDRHLVLGDVAIDRYSYYERGDVLYLMVGPPHPAADDDDSLEGDVVFFDPDGSISGVTMIGAREALEQDGTLKVTLPSRGIAVRWPRELVEPLLVETLRYA